MTLTERVIRFLTVGLHKQELPSKTKKYRKFTGTKPDSFYFIGKAGAIRAGKTSSDSISLTGQVHSNMKLWEKKHSRDDEQ